MTFALQLLSLVAIIDKSATINLNALTNQIGKEADRLKSRRTKGGKKDTTDEALTATASDNRRQRCCKGKCHNCGKKGHWANECQSLKKDRVDSTGTMTMQASSTSFKPVTDRSWCQSIICS
jgi:hypothetical protein